MADDLGFFGPVSAPLLERVIKEERIGREHPRRRHDDRLAIAHIAEPPPEEASSSPFEEAQTSTSVNHIDLRI